MSPQSFADYVTDRYPALLRAAYGIASDPNLAEDLLQASLARVGAHWGSLRNQGAADAYVRRAMRNQQASWYREKWRSLEVVTDRPPEAAEDPTHWEDHLGDDGRHLWPLVAALPPRQRAAVALRFYEGLTEAETARALGCSIGTVKSSTSRGLAALRRTAAAAGHTRAGALAG